MKKSNLAVLALSSLLLLSACDATMTTTSNIPSTSSANKESTNPNSTPTPTDDTITTTSSSTSSPSSTNVTASTAPLKLQNQSIKEETKTYLVDIAYPSTGITAIDTDIKAIVDDQFDSFKKDIGDMPADSVVGLNSLYVTYEHFNFHDQYLSIKFTFSTYTGGAHPNAFFITKTYDTATGKALALSDLFQSNSDYLAKLSSISIDQLKAGSQFLKAVPAEERDTDENTKWITEGASPKAENYQDWVLTNNNLEIYFEPYQVASYAEGAQTVDINLGDLGSILSPAFN